MSLKKVLQARAWICVGVVPLVMGCSPHKELTSEDSVQQEVRDYEEAIKEIQQDASLTEKQKETAIKPFHLRLDEMTTKAP